MGGAVMAKSANLYARIEPNVKSEAEAILSPIDIGNMTQEEFNAEIQKGLDDITNGRVKPATEVFSGIRKKYNV